MTKLINSLMMVVVLSAGYVCIASLNVEDAIPMAHNSHLIQLAGK